MLDYNESSQSSSSTPNYTFKKAVDNIKTNRTSYSNVSSTSSAGFNADGSIKSVTSFGKGFVAPQKRVQHNTSFVVKSKNNQANAEARKKQEEERMKELLENNPIKKMLMEKKMREAQESEAKANANIQAQTATTSNIQENTSSTQNLEFKAGDRVFHSKFGVGKVSDVKVIGASSMIIVDFGSQGQKALDASFAQLKKF